MGFPEFAFLGNKTTEEAKNIIGGGLGGFSAFINSQKVLRAYVQGSPGYGHTAATVSLIRKIAAPVTDKYPGFGYQGIIEVCAEMTNKIDGKTIKEKLLELIPELKGGDTGTINNATINLIDLGKDPDLDMVPFGFCGGDDFPNHLTGEYGTLKDLKVASFLLIQPYMWKIGSTADRNPLQVPGNLLFYLNEGEYEFKNLDTFRLTRPYGIADRGFGQPIKMLTPDDWTEILKLTPDPVKLLVQIMKDLTTEVVRNEFDLLPLYGINFPGDTGFLKPASNRLALMLATYYKALENWAVIKRPIIINFGRYIPGTDIDMSLAKVKALAMGGSTAPELIAKQIVDHEENPEAKKSLQALVNNARNRQMAFQLPEGDFFKVVDYSTITSEDKLTALLEWQKGNRKRVLMIQGDRVPPLVFEYVMKLAGLPAVFEGNNTAMTAITAGKPYLHTRDYHILDMPTQYPLGIVGKSDYNKVAALLQKIANKVQADFTQWPANIKQAANVQLANFIDNVYPNNKEFFDYFGSVMEFYENKLNDKFNISAAFTYGLLTALKVWPSMFKEKVRATFAEVSSLEQLLQNIQQEISQKGYVDLLNDILSSGGIHDYLAAIAGNIIVNDPVVTDEKDGQQQIIKVLLTGTTNAFDTATNCSFVFTVENNALTCAADFTGADTWLMDGVPWIVFESPTFATLSSDGELPPSGKVVAKLQNTDLEISVALPDARGIATGTASFEQPVSINSLAAFAGGINLSQYVPDVISKLANIGVKDLSFAYNIEANTLDHIIINIGSTEDWQIMSRLHLQQLNLQIVIQSPGDMQNREVTAVLSGNLLIGDDPKGPVFAMSATIPELYLSGQLTGSALSLDTLLNVFWDGVRLDWPGGNTPSISSLVVGYGVKSKNYQLDISVDLNWPITINGTDVLTVDAISMYLIGGTGFTLGGLSGSLTILPDSANIGLLLTADYLGNNNGWRFASKQTSGYISLIELFTFYLPPAWKPDPNDFDIQIDGLGVTIETISNSWEFTAKTYQPIKVPYTDLEISGNLKLGYKGPSTGYYGAVSAEVEWNDIDLTLYYNFDPTIKAFGVACEVADVTIKGEIKTENNKSKATLSFAGSPTIGGIIETFITWATGSKFGLASPWSILNDIPLPNVSLIYDFTDKTVSFDVKIGPIELGFATINGINVSYNTNDPDPNKNGVMVTLKITSSFGDVKPWNAAKPEETPAPPGQGNKYLDLRMLAMGQHTTIKDLNKANSVKEAIEFMEKMPIPEKGKIPLVTFDPNSSWLIGMDFGVLKLGDDQSNALVIAPNPNTPGYLLTLQMVFNDPNLYGLRIALAGEAAKVFSGLDFQIMYKKISDSVGVYMAEITLPDKMRKIKMGEFNITLPVFGIQLYTNGDFQVDIGFPWKQDFSRSLTFEALIITPIGIPIPVMGSLGIYFGKLSSATTNKVPQSDKGTFNPVFVFGYGMQFGLGYSFEEGPLKAGFSLTIVAILEGVLAKFNPYKELPGPTNNTQLETAYYFWIRGTVGIIGKLYGSIDFSIIKASLTIDIRVIAQITFTPYEPILLSITASVDVSLEVTISLGIFKISISFSFSARVSQSVTLPAIGGKAPWAPDTAYILTSRLSRRLPHYYKLNEATTIPVWSNLIKATTAIPLKGYLGLGLTVAGDAATTTAQQLACYVSMLFIESVPPPQHDKLGCVQSAFEDKTLADTDTSFETLCKMIFRWAVAAIQPNPVTSDEVDNLVITDEQLKQLLEYLSNRNNPVPIASADIETFMSNQFLLTVIAAQQEGAANGTYFPVPDSLHFSVPAYGNRQALSYSYGDYNSLSANYINEIAEYFDELAISLQQKPGSQLYAAANNATTSMGSFVFGDYFLLLCRQMIQAARNSLKDLKYFLQQGDTPQSIVDWVQQNGQPLYDIQELFTDNAALALTANGNQLSITNSSYLVQTSDTFDSISKNAVYASAFTGAALALFNSDTKNILKAGIAIQYPLTPVYTTLPGQSLTDIANALTVSVQDLIDNTAVLTLPNLLLPVATINIPLFDHTVQNGDTLRSIAARFGITPAILATPAANSQVANLFDSATIDIVYLGQFKVAQLLAEIQATQGLQHLSGMASRYYMAGLRLPTNGITPQYPGMWVQQNDNTFTLPPYAGLYALTGQQFPLPAAIQQNNYDITYSISSGWLVFDGANPSQVVISIIPGQVSAQQIQAVTTYAVNNRLDEATSFLGAGGTFNSQYTTYPFTSEINWNCPASTPMPYGNFTPGVPSLKWWNLPDTLLSLPNTSRAIDPRVQILLGQYNNATGAMVTSAVNYYGYATQLAFTIKKIPPIANSPATLTTYEITGADGANADILEKIVFGIGNDDAKIASLSLAFAVDPNGSTSQGLQSDNPQFLTMGIAKANLSTDTRPDMAVARAMDLEALATVQEFRLLNTPSGFINLLWEAGITRAGGFYLYYYNAQEASGLPDRIFNDQGETTLHLLVMYTAPSNSSLQNNITDYMNTLVTAEAIDTSNAVLFAQADPMQVVLSSNDKQTLQQLAFDYYGNVADIAVDNEYLTLRSGITILISEGVFEVGPTGAGPDNLDAIATWFNTTADAIKNANPLRQQWPNPLPLFTTILLPEINVVIGSGKGGNTLASVAAYYGQNLSSLANFNQRVAGIFADNQSIAIQGGPVTRSATVPAGVVAMEAIRPVPHAVPDKPTDADYAKYFLQNTYSLLTYQLVENEFFNASNISLPVSPIAAPVDPNDLDKIRAPRVLAFGDDWNFKLSIPYSRFSKQQTNSRAGLPDPINSPYRGVGDLLSVHFAWQDYYGNQLITTLSQPQPGAILDQPPVLTGYTDQIMGLNQWPSVNAAWVVKPGNNQDPQLQLPFNFDNSPYQGLNNIQALNSTTVLASFTVPLDQASATTIANYSFTQQERTIDINNITLNADQCSVTITVDKLEMGDDLTITLNFGNISDANKVINPDTSLTFSGVASFFYAMEPTACTTPVTQNALRDLQAYQQLWYQLTDTNGIRFSVTTTLLQQTMILTTNQVTSLVQGWIASIYGFLADRAVAKTAVPAPPLFTLSFPIDFSILNNDQIFKLDLSFLIERTGGSVAGDFETTGGIKQVSSIVAMYSEKTGTTYSFDAFAQQFEQALQLPDKYVLRVATGVDRTDNLGAPGEVWAVRKGFKNDNAISYQVNSTPAPAVFAPRPMSNVLENYTQIPIYDFDPKTGIAPDPSRWLDFSGIDMDQWAKILFSSIDTVLSPTYTAAVQLVDEYFSSQYYVGLINSKSQLADIVKKWMIPVFDNESADATGVQESFRQLLLVQLSNAYNANAAIQFTATVQAATPNGIAPRLYGAVTQKLPVDPAGGNYSDSVSITAAKLDLAPATNAPVNCIVTSPQIVKDDTGTVIPYIDLDLNYQANTIEHQISRLTPDNPYLASSWLHFLTADGNNSFVSPLGKSRVPLFLRSFPATPAMVEQVGNASVPSMVGVDFNTLLNWDYIITYSQQFHYPQDILSFEINFNVKDSSSKYALNDSYAVFAQFAEFITVLPGIQDAFNKTLAKIDAQTTDNQLFADGAVVLQSYNYVVNQIINAANSSINGLAMTRPGSLRMSTDALPYNFDLDEGIREIDQVEAFVISISEKVPEGIEKIEVQLDNCDTFIYSGDDCTAAYCFYFKDKTTGSIITAAEGQQKANRTIVLSQMNILARQDAETLVQVTRNERLVPGTRSAEPFIYTTGQVGFSNNYHPVINIDSLIDISTLNAPDGHNQVPLIDQLRNLFSALLLKNTQPVLSFQMSCNYSYTINPAISDITVPVLMQPLIEVQIMPNQLNEFITLEQLINSWANAIKLWWFSYQPNYNNGAFNFDLNVFSNLTEQPLPLLELSKLTLGVQYITDLNND